MNDALIQQIDKLLAKRLEHVVTKDDLSRFATKDDLKRELSNYPTKEDLRKELSAYATKEDLKRELSNHPSKKDLEKVIEEFGDTILDAIELRTLSKNEFRKLEKRVDKIEDQLHSA